MFSKIAVKRPVTTVMILLMLFVIGTYSIIGMPQALMPDVEYPYAMVMMNYPGAGPDEVESLVTEPVEKALASVSGMKEMTSVSFEGMSVVMLELNMDTDMNFATLDMREKISLIAEFLPDEVGSPTIMKADMDSIPVMQLYVSSDMDLVSLHDHIENNVAPKVEKISGVASIAITGAVSNEVAIDLDQEKLTGYGLTLSNLSSLLASENISLPSGNVTVGSKEFIVRTNGEFSSIEEIKTLPITIADGSVVMIQDVATVMQQQKKQESLSRIDGNRAIGVNIMKTSGANLVGLSDDVQKAMSDLQKKYPDIDITIGFDQSDYVRSSISSVVNSAIAGGILAIIVIFLFLRNFRSTLVIGISIPASVVATFIVMRALDMTLNMFTLAALTLAVGMLVDNSVVVLENIFRRNKMGLDPHDAAIEGSKEVGLAVAASTLTSVVVYLPIALSGGLAGMMFKDFSFTIVAALVVSLAVAVTIVPMLCSRLLDSSLSEDYVRIGKHFYKYKIIVKFTEFIDDLRENYGRAIGYALNHRKKTLAIFVAIFIASTALIGAVGMELIPQSDEGSFSVSITVPYGTSLNEQDNIASEIEEYLLNMPELEHLTLTVGSAGTMFSSSSNGSTLNATLVGKDERSRSTKQIMNDVKEHFSDIAGVEIEYKETSSMSMSISSADISLDLTGNDLDMMRETASDLSQRLRTIEGITDVSADVEDGNPEVKVKLNRTNASFYGVTAYQLANGLSQALSGTTATKLKVGGDEIDISLSLPEEFSSSIDSLKQIMITTPRGQQVPVGQIAEFEYDNAPTQILRVNQQNQVSVQIFVEERDLNDVTADVYKYLDDEYDLPEGIIIGTSGMTEEMMESFSDLLKALVVSVLLVYLVLAAQFESMILPLMVMTSIPFAMSGAFLALFLAGNKLSMPAFIGLIMLIGIVVNNAILLVEFIKHNKLSMGTEKAIIEAGKVRLRPILMTSLTTCTGMIPMAMGIGEGTEVTAPMGISIIGGMIASTFVTMIIIPIMYAVVEETEEKNRNRRLWKKENNSIREKIWLKEQAITSSEVKSDDLD